nr:hypothetical protein [Amycolatopsis sp. AA4]
MGYVRWARGWSGGHEDLVGMLVTAKQHGHYELGAVDYATVAIGPDEAADVVQLGLVGTTAPDGSPVLVGVRGSAPQYGQANCRLEVIAVFDGAGSAVAGAIAFKSAIPRLDCVG